MGMEFTKLKPHSDREAMLKRTSTHFSSIRKPYYVILSHFITKPITSRYLLRGSMFKMSKVLFTLEKQFSLKYE